MKWRVNGTRRFGSFHGFPQSIGSPGALTIWMEKPGILGRIQMERFIPVKDLPSVVMTIFLLLPNWPGNFCTINLSTTTSARLFPRKQHAKRKMAAWNIDSWLFQTVYSCDRCCFRFSSPLQSRSLFSASFQTFCLIEYAKIWTVLQSRGQGGKFPNFFLVCRHTLLPTVHMLLQKQVPIQCAQPVIVVLSEMIERINVEKCTKIWTSGSLPLPPPSFPFHPFHVPPSVRSVILPPWYRLFITAVVCKCLGN